MSWDKAADTLLVERWREGRTMAEIASELGVSRGAIAGRKRRLTEQGHAFEEREPAFPEKVVAAIKPVERGVVRHDNGIEYLRLGPDGCKAILDKRGSDGLRMCCGRLRENGKPYCPGHVAQYGKVEDRRIAYGKTG